MGYHRYVFSHFLLCFTLTSVTFFLVLGAFWNFVPHFPYLQNENNDSIYLPVLLWGLNIFIQEKCLQQSV